MSKLQAEGENESITNAGVADRELFLLSEPSRNPDSPKSSLRVFPDALKAPKLTETSHDPTLISAGNMHN